MFISCCDNLVAALKCSK